MAWKWVGAWLLPWRRLWLLSSSKNRFSANYDRLALSAVWFPHRGAAMLARYFFRVALIVAAVLSLVQPAQASGTVPPVSSGYTITTPVLAPLSSVTGGSAGAVCDAAVAQMNSGTWYPAHYKPVTKTGNTNTLCYFVFPSGLGGGNHDIAAGAASCPTNSTGTTICTCTDPYIPNAEATACVMPACPAADSLAGAYWIKTGTIPDSIYTAGNGNFCSNGCQTYSFLSIPRPAGYPVEDGAYKVVAGVKTFYSFREYAYTGATCTGGDTLPVASTLPATDTCAPGQSMIQMGLKFRCINPATGETVDTNSVSAVAAAKTLADVRIAAQIVAAGSAVAAAGGSASDVAAAQSVAAGVAAAAVGAAGTNPDPVQAAFCAENPTASICVASDFGSVEDSNLTDKTVNVAITPVSVGGAGSCPAPSAMVLHGQTYYFDWTTYCNFANMIKPILLAFAWLAAAGILVGGFMA